MHPQARLGRRKQINVWVRDQSPHWQISLQLGNLDLALLTSYMLRRNWDGKINLMSVVKEASQEAGAQVYLRNLVDLARLQVSKTLVEVGDFNDYVSIAPAADVQIFGFPDDIDFAFVRRMVTETRSTCMFVRDSGDENALA